MRLLKNFLLTVFIAVVILFKLTTFGYAFFDNLSYIDNVNSLQIGSWSYALTPYFTGFENFTNSNTNTTNVNIDGLNWSLQNVVSSKSNCDNKFETTCAKIVQVGSLTTENYFTNLKEVSFYVSYALNSDRQGNRKFTVDISNNSNEWLTIYSSRVYYSFNFHTINIEQLLSNGLVLPDGFIANTITPLKIRLNFDGSGPSGTRIYNIDNLSIV
jgi:hypothetical protein